MACYIYTKDVDHFQPETSTLNFCSRNSNLFLPKIIAKHCSLKTRARSCLGLWCRPGILPVSLIFQIPMSFWRKSAPSLSSWEATKRSSTYTKTRMNPFWVEVRNCVLSNVSCSPTTNTVFWSSKNQSKGALRKPFIALYNKTMTFLPPMVMLGGIRTRSHASDSTGAFMNATLTSTVGRLKSPMTDTARTHLSPSKEEVGA